MNYNLASEVIEELHAGEKAQIFDWKTAQRVVIRPSDIDPRRPTLRQINAILREGGIKPRRFPRDG
jgi:hypothetical protein